MHRNLGKLAPSVERVVIAAARGFRCVGLIAPMRWTARGSLRQTGVYGLTVVD